MKRMARTCRKLFVYGGFERARRRSSRGRGKGDEGSPLEAARWSCCKGLRYFASLGIAVVCMSCDRQRPTEDGRGQLTRTNHATEVMHGDQEPDSLGLEVIDIAASVVKISPYDGGIARGDRVSYSSYVSKLTLKNPSANTVSCITLVITYDLDDGSSSERTVTVRARTPGGVILGGAETIEWRFDSEGDDRLVLPMSQLTVPGRAIGVSCRAKSLKSK